MLGPLSRKNGFGQMDCRLCLDYWGTTTCVVSSRPARTESAEDPFLVQRDISDSQSLSRRCGAILQGPEK
jgi:hypothetical protein